MKLYYHPRSRYSQKVLIALYEKDIPFLREGQAISATVEAFPARVFSGTIALVHPHLESATRTNIARFTMDNPKHDLRPGMFATVRIATPIERAVAVPERAVIDTGSKKIVYVEREAGTFEGVLVQLGPRVGAFYPVIAGLEPSVIVSVLAVAAACPTEKAWFTTEESERALDATMATVLSSLAAVAPPDPATTNWRLFAAETAVKLVNLRPAIVTWSLAAKSDVTLSTAVLLLSS